MARKTHEQFLKDMEEKGNPNVEIVGEYVDNETKIKCRCKINPKHEWEATPSNLLRKRGCPFCRGLKVNETNSVKSLRPDLVKYFKNESDSEKISLFSHKKVELKCPDCGYEKEMTMSKLTQKGFSCDICGDGVSFPNKFIRNMLIMLNIPFICEWTPEWNKHIKYDVKIKNKKILIEMDGFFHKKESYYKTLDRNIKQDKIKTKEAEENGYLLFRVDALESDGKYLYNSIKESGIFDTLKINIDNFDFIECERISQKSLLVEVCNFYNNHKNYTQKEIAEEMQLNVSLVGRYIRKGIKIGLCENYAKNKKKKVLVYKENKLIRIYSSRTMASKMLLKEFGIKFILDGELGKKGEIKKGDYILKIFE